MLFLLFVPTIFVGCQSTPETPNGTQTEQSQTTSTTTPENAEDSLTKDWVTYTAKDNEYTIKFPGTPQEQTQTQPTKIGDIKLLIVTYEDKQKRRAFLTNSITYPVDPKKYDAQKGLEGAKTGVLENGKQSKLVAEKNLSKGDLLGKELIIRDQDGIGKKLRIFVDPKGPTLYQTLVVVEKGDFDFPEADAFLDSFVINK